MLHNYDNIKQVSDGWHVLTRIIIDSKPVECLHPSKIWQKITTINVLMNACYLVITNYMTFLPYSLYLIPLVLTKLKFGRVALNI